MSIVVHWQALLRSFETTFLSQRIKHQKTAALVAWKAEAIASRRKHHAALSTLRLKRKQDLLTAWMHTAFQQAWLIERLGVLINSRHLHTSGQTFRAWRGLTADSAEQDRRAESQFQDRLLLNGITAWRQQAVHGKHQQRESLKLASRHCDYTILDCSFQGFRAYLKHCRRVEHLLHCQQEAKKERVKVQPQFCFYMT